MPVEINCTSEDMAIRAKRIKFEGLPIDARDSEINAQGKKSEESAIDLPISAKKSESEEVGIDHKRITPVHWQSALIR
eukprot:1087295-Amphidinium_carterae.3